MNDTAMTLPVCRPEVNAREREIVAAALQHSLGNILTEVAAENLAYAVLVALRVQSFDDEGT